MSTIGDVFVRLLLDTSPTQPIGRVGQHPVLVGRGKGCDVVVGDRYVSRHHLLVWYGSGKLRVRDCGSALGTKVGNRNVGPGEALSVEPGERILLADRVPVTWDATEIVAMSDWYSAGAIMRDGPTWRFDSGLPLSRPELSDPTNSLDTTLPGEAIWWAIEGGDAQRCSLTISVAGGVPERARFDQPGEGMVTVRDESRVVLLYLLAMRRRLFDKGGCESAWVNDFDLAVGLWGARGHELPPSRLNTVVARVRQQLQKANLPRSLVEKQTGATRLGAGIGEIAIQGTISGKVASLSREP